MENLSRGRLLVLLTSLALLLAGTVRAEAVLALAAVPLALALRKVKLGGATPTGH